MTFAPPPPSPIHLLRSNSSPIHSVCFSDDNERLYSGDLSGQVIVTSTRSLRAIASWRAHQEGILGVEEWATQIITHGRDNKLHVWSRVDEPSASTSIRLGGAAALPDLPTPQLFYSLDVNALNFCRFSLLPLLAHTESRGQSISGDLQHEALIAVPNLVESSLTDIWSLPSCQRLHAAIGKQEEPEVSTIFSDGRGPNTGIIMSMHLFKHNRQTSTYSAPAEDLHLLCAYENGSVSLRRYSKADKATSVEGVGWDVIWSVKLHVESIMAMAVSRDHTFALTVSADHLVGRYNLFDAEDMRGMGSASEDARKVFRTKYPGNSAVAIRDDGKVCAVGGWDGKIRLYSTKSLKPLGTLQYHKQTCQTVAFARSLLDSVESGDGPAMRTHATATADDDDEDEEMAEEEKQERSQWLIAGGKDGRVSIWALMSFAKT